MMTEHTQCSNNAEKENEDEIPKKMTRETETLDQLRQKNITLKEMLIVLLLSNYKLRGKSKQFQRVMWREETADYLLNEWSSKH